jgi:hypothetical protein
VLLIPIDLGDVCDICDLCHASAADAIYAMSDRKKKVDSATVPAKIAPGLGTLYHSAPALAPYFCHVPLFVAVINTYIHAYLDT